MRNIIMKSEAMFEILIYLFENYFDSENCPDSETLTRKLTLAGFGEDEISQILGWLTDHTKHEAGKYPVTLSQSKSFRIYSSSELEVIDVESQGFILFLEQAGVLNSLQRELLIDRILQMDGSSSCLDKIKLVVMFDLWVQNQLTNHDLIEKLFIASNPRNRH